MITTKKLFLKNLNSRFNVIVIIVISLFLLLIFRLSYLTVVEHNFLKTQGESRSIKKHTVVSLRKNILDRNNNIVATSIPNYIASINPRSFQLSNVQLNEIAKILDIDANQLSSKIKHNISKKFLILHKDVNEQQKSQVQKITNQIKWSSFSKRFYPDYDAFSSLLGFASHDTGIEGLEYSYNDTLSSKIDSYIIKRNCLGQAYAPIDLTSNLDSAKDIVLTIDRRLQNIAYKHLKDSILHHDALLGSVIIIDIKNAEILALVNYQNPSYSEKLNPMRNHAVLDCLELGSVFKPITFLALMNKVDLNAKIDTNPGKITIADHTIYDVRNFGIIAINEILKYSSNVGLIKLIKQNPEINLSSFFSSLGLLDSVLNLPGESGGYINSKNPNKLSLNSSLATGYSIAISPLTITNAYAQIASYGKVKPLTILNPGIEKKSTYLFPKEHSLLLIDMLEKAVNYSGRAIVNNYKIAGKSGTARKINLDTYEKKYISSFIGIGPTEDPELVVGVFINEPKKNGYYGGIVATPAFTKIMKESLILRQRTNNN